MNGLQIIDLNKASFMDKILRREPSENAYVEINNLVACVPILKLDRESINNCLAKYEVSHSQAHSRLLNFYSQVLRYFVSDLNISNQQLQELAHLQYIFDLQEKEVNSVKSSILYPIYQNFIRNTVSNGILSDEEKDKLENLSVSLTISKDVARNLYKLEAHRYLESVLKKSLSNGMLSPDEEAELDKIAKDLQVSLQLTENANKNLQRHRYMWQLYVGKLPKIETNIYLDKEEFCSAIVQAEHYEIATIYQPVKYSGYDKLRGVSGTGFQAGRVRKNEAVGKSMCLIDSGNLFFTNKRLILKGNNKIYGFPLLSIMGGTFYSNGLMIEQYRGRDQFFKFTGDMEILKLIFDSLMTNCRK